MDECTKHRINYFALNVQFVNINNEVRIYTLAVRDTENQHSSDFIQKLVEDVLDDFEISKLHIFAVVKNNASKMTPADKQLSEDSTTVADENELESTSTLHEETSLALRYNSEFRTMTHMRVLPLRCSWQ